MLRLRGTLVCVVRMLLLLMVRGWVLVLVPVLRGGRGWRVRIAVGRRLLRRRWREPLLHVIWRVPWWRRWWRKGRRVVLELIVRWWGLVEVRGRRLLGCIGGVLGVRYLRGVEMTCQMERGERAGVACTMRDPRARRERGGGRGKWTLT